MAEEVSNKKLAILFKTIIMLLIAIMILVCVSTMILIVDKFRDCSTEEKCHIENMVEKIDVGCGKLSGALHHFSHGSNYICEDGIRVEEYEMLGHNTIYGCLGKNEGVCLIEKEVKVCD